MFRIANIIQKDLKILLRSRASALIIILGPLLLILLVGMAFSGSTLNNIRVGVYSPSYSELTNSLITTLENNQFVVTKTESLEQCILDTKYGKFHVCAVFPPDFKVGATTDNASINNNVITFHVDYSRVNIVYTILDTISKQVSVKSSELSGELVQVLLDTLENSRITLISKKEGVTELSTLNSETKQEADAILDKVNALSIDFNISEVEDNLKELKNETNNSALINAIEDVEDELEGITSEITASVNAKNEIQEKGLKIKNTASENSKKLTALKTSLESIIGNIESIKITERETIVSPIRTQIEPLTSRKSHWNTLFPTLVMLMVSFVGLLLATTLVVREKSTKAYFRNFITPTKDIIFIIGTYLTCLIVLVSQLIIIFGQAAYILKAELLTVLATIAFFLFLISSVFIFLGMVIGYVFKSEETAVLASMSVAAFLLFFSNTILPIESIPPSLKVLASFNPFVLGEAVMKKLILFQAPLSTLTFEMFMLIGYLALFVVLTFLTRDFNKRKVQ